MQIRLQVNCKETKILTKVAPMRPLGYPLQMFSIANFFSSGNHGAATMTVEISKYLVLQKIHPQHSFSTKPSEHDCLAVQVVFFQDPY